MNIYVKPVDKSSKNVIFPSLPETIEVQAATRFMTFDLINNGEVKIPLGEELVKFSWSGIFFGKSRRNERFVKKWVDPKEMQVEFSRWRNSGTKLRLLITDTTINHDVYLVDYKCTYTGGYGDMEYSVTFVVAKDLIVKTEKKVTDSKASQNKESSSSSEQSTAKTYTVGPNDTLWKIAQKVYGDGSKYTKIYEANKDIIKNPNIIRQGQVLKLP